ncbi:MAG TPA: hypothetical protein VMX14_12905 [Anaerolineae bacterium]|nr:hypothetical protein [Anaerolineae bacterium]
MLARSAAVSNGLLPIPQTGVGRPTMRALAWQSRASHSPERIEKPAWNGAGRASVACCVDTLASTP